MSRLPALAAALLLPAAQPVLLSAAVSSAALLLAEAPAQAQSAEAVGRVAKAITVRIEGATQGSGVLVKRDGNRYTVLTAWHVVSSQGPGEELDVYTPDGKRHSVEQGSVQRLGAVDMAVLTFSSSTAYAVARVGNVKSVSSGSSIYVSGFPLPTSAVPSRLFRFLDGRVIANSTVAVPNGYQLLYSNQTLPGMSGGAVLNAEGQLVGIHGRSETDVKMSEQIGVAVKTGTNQAVLISYYKNHFSYSQLPLSNKQSVGQDSIDILGNRENQANGMTGLVDKPEALQLLYSLLQRNDYAGADLATAKLILGSIGQDILLPDSISKIPCELLLELDAIWDKGSQGTFGFRSQFQLQKNGYTDFELLSGWRKGGFFTSIDKLPVNIPAGYYPRKVANGPITIKLNNHVKWCHGKISNA